MLTHLAKVLSKERHPEVMHNATWPRMRKAQRVVVVLSMCAACTALTCVICSPLVLWCHAWMQRLKNGSGNLGVPSAGHAAHVAVCRADDCHLIVNDE